MVAHCDSLPYDNNDLRMALKQAVEHFDNRKLSGRNQPKRVGSSGLRKNGTIAAVTRLYEQSLASAA